MFLPLILITLAIAGAAGMAYGMHPALAQYDHGLQIIMIARRLQWPLVTVSLVLCVALLVLVISGKRRVWWLIGLGPVVALFFHHFAQVPPNRMTVRENPAFVDARSASFMGDRDWVVGVIFDAQTYAYPYRVLWSTPIVIQADHDKRMMLMWSPLANCAKVYEIDRQLKGRDLEVVAMPAAALLVYNARVGQFINAVRGELAKGGKPTGFEAPIASRKMTWKEWLALHPDTRVLAAEQVDPSAPAVPIAEQKPSAVGSPPADLRIAFIPTTQPLAIQESELSFGPVNATAGTLPVLLFRDDATGATHAFDRRIEADLIPRFELNHDARRKDVKFVDRDTGTGWSVHGVALDGPTELKGKKLQPVDVEEGLYWGVMKHWYPDLELFTPAERSHPLGDAITGLVPTTVTPEHRTPTARAARSTRTTPKKKPSARAN